MPDTRNWFAAVPERRRRALARSRRRGVWIEVDGKRLIDFAANDYLGLADHPAVRRAAVETIERRGFGGAASRLVSGDAPELHELEAALADWKGYEAALVVGSGSLANVGLLDAAADRHTELFADRLVHASLVDGARLGRGRLRRFPHRDLGELEGMLAVSRAARKILVSDGVFSMDGDVADVAGLVALAERFDALAVVDDAHGTGICGPGGRGVVAEAGRAGHPRLVEVGTLGKAFGGYGAFVLGRRAFIEGLCQRLRTLIYSTALPPCAPAAALAALAEIRRGELRARLTRNVERFRARCEGLPLAESATPIQPLLIGGDDDALAASARLREAGFFVPAIRPPTVPEGTARLRITLSAAHEPEQIDRLADALRALAP